MNINTVKEFLTALKSPYAWPGGYPLYFITSDGAALSFKTAKKEKRLIAASIKEKQNDGWRVVGVDVNWEDANLIDDHSGERIESAYAEDEAAGQNPKSRVKRNPRGASGVRIVHNRLLGGWYIVRGPHQTPLGGRFDSKEAAQAHLRDQQSARDSRAPQYVRTGYGSNPKTRGTLAAHAAAVNPKRKTGKGRVLVQAGLSDSGPWVTISAYPNTADGKEKAIAEAKTVHKAHPNQPMRVWQTK